VPTDAHGENIGANQGELLRTLARVGLRIVRLAKFNLADDLKAGQRWRREGITT